MIRARRIRPVLRGCLVAAVAASLLPAVAPAAPPALPNARLEAVPAPVGHWSADLAAERWSVDLAVAGGDDVNVRWEAGRLRLADT
ncbi:hypothetical protein E1193_29585, partial [Micromonospora sp. KC606]